MSSSKKLHVKGLCGRYLSEAQNQEPHTPPHLHTVYVYTVYLFKQVRGGEEQQFTKLGRKYQRDWLYLQSINSDNTCRKVPV